MNMRRTLVLVALGLGAVLSFFAGARSIAHHQQHGWGPRWGSHEARLDQMAEACVRAAERRGQAGEPEIQ
jgi:hypothetical protein